MKIVFYFDVQPYTKPENIFVSISPYEKMPGAKRYKVELEIPDPAMPDETIQAEAIEEQP